MRTMNRAASLCAVGIVAFALAACDRSTVDTSASTPASTQPVESKVLRAELESAYADATAGKPDYQVKATRADADRVAPVVLKATPDQEKRFAAGKFDDDGNRQRVKKQMDLLKDFGTNGDL